MTTEVDSGVADGSGSASGDGGGSGSADAGGSLSADGGGSASADGGGSASADGGGSASADGGGSASGDGSASGSASASASDDGSASTSDGNPVSVDPCIFGCPTGVCDPSSGLCVGCLDDGDCTADDPYCETTTQECVGCLGDEHCPAGWVCDPSTNSCSCTQDVQCAVDEICNDLGSCVPTDVPGGECVTGTECDPSLGCGAGYCLRCQGNGNFCNECADDADCAAVYMCNTGLASCVECLTTNDCLEEDGTGDQICHPYGECGLPCTGNADCPHDRTCDEWGRCVPPPPGSNCTDDGECPAGAQCVAGLCKACVVGLDGISCQACQPGQSDCADGTLCDNDVFVCVECQNDAGCAAGEVCNFGACALP